MSRDPESLIDILTAIRRILRYTEGISRNDLENNDEKISAVLYQIGICRNPEKFINQRSAGQELPYHATP
jgi:uncharacterized protein with HEPN domain